jgi:flagellar motility protein MotE (MotC chaperone)
MEPEFAAGFLGRMRPEAAAAVLGGMSAPAAYRVSLLLAARNSAVPRE